VFSVLVVPRDRASDSTKANKLARDESPKESTSEPSLPSPCSLPESRTIQFHNPIWLAIAGSRKLSIYGTLRTKSLESTNSRASPRHPLRFRYPPTVLWMSVLSLLEERRNGMRFLRSGMREQPALGFSHAGDARVRSRASAR